MSEFILCMDTKEDYEHQESAVKDNKDIEEQDKVNNTVNNERVKGEV